MNKIKEDKSINAALENEGVSPKDREEIFKEIEEVVQKSRIELPGHKAKLPSEKKGVFLPVMINVMAAAAIVGTFFLADRLFQSSQEGLNIESQSYLDSSGSIIEQQRRDAERALEAKEAEINNIQAELSRLDQEKADLQASKEQEIAAKEAELRAEMEAALEAERQRLQEMGTSASDIELKLTELEGQQQAAAEAQLSALRTQAEAVVLQKQRELDNARNLLDDATTAREALVEQHKEEEAELRAQLAAEKAAIQAEATEAEQRLSEMTRQQEQMNLINTQILGSYETIMSQITAEEYETALTSINNLENLVKSPEFNVIPQLAARKSVELFVLDALKQEVIPKTGAAPAAEGSLLEAANLLVSARELAAQGRSEYSEGNTAAARQYYQRAIEKIPTLLDAYTSIQTIDDDATLASVLTTVSAGKSAVTQGDQNEALSQFRQAALIAAGRLSEPAKEALDSLEALQQSQNQALQTAHQNAMNSLNDELTTSSEKVRALETTLDSSEALYSTLETQLRQSDEEVSRLKEELTQADVTIKNLESEAGMTEQTRLELVSKIETLNSELDLSRGNLRTKEQEFAELQDQLLELQNALSDDKSALEELHLTDEAAKERIEQLEAELGSTQKDLEILRSEHTEQLKNIDNLNTLLAEQEEKQAALTEEITAIRHLKSRNQDTIAEQSELTSRLYDKITLLTEENTKLQFQLESLRSRIVTDEEQTGEVSAATAEELKELQDQLAALDAALAGKERENSLLKTSVLELEHKNTALQETLIAGTNSDESLRQAFSEKDAELSVLRTQLMEQIELSNTLSDNLDTATAENSELSAKLGESQNKNSSLSESVKATTDVNSRLQSQIAELNSTVAARDADIEEKKTAITTLETEIAELKDQRRQLQNDLEQAATDLYAVMNEQESPDTSDEDTVINSMMESYSQFEEEVNVLLARGGDSDLVQADSLLAQFLGSNHLSKIFPGLTGYVDTIKEGKLAILQREAENIGRESALNDVLNFTRYLSGKSLTSEEQSRFSERIDSDALYRETTEEIQQLTGLNTSQASSLSQVASFIGTVSTATDEGYVVETFLTTIDLNSGDKVRIKRSTRYNTEVIIGEGIITRQSGTRVEIALTTLENSGEDPRIGDLVYLLND